MTHLKETHSRTVAKVISWRVALTISHIVNAFVVTGSIATGLQIAGLAAVINSCLFWLHERVWNRVGWNRRPDEELKFNEGQPRTLTKIITWRVLITISNFVIPWIMTGSWKSGLAFLTLATVVNVIIYWLHERVWNRAKWGKNVSIAS